MHRASALVEIVPKEEIASSSPIAQKQAIRLRGSTRNARPLRQISIQELESANSVEKPWVAVRGKVYDLTNFVDKHPGGRDFLLLSVGRDATSLYESMHSEMNTKVLNKYYIGQLMETNVPQYSEQSEFYQVVQNRVEAYFKKIGKNPRDAPVMLWTYAFLAVSFVASYFTMMWKPTSWTFVLVPWIGAALHGWTCAMMGFYLCHDGCHASFSKSPLVWNALRRVYESFTGLSTLLWIYQHGLGHHPFTNVAGADPDIVSDSPGTIRVHGEQPWWNHYSWQKYYWLPLYSQLILSRKLTEWKNVFYDFQYKHIRINPPQASEYMWFLIVTAIYATQHYILPITSFHIGFFRMLALHTVTDLVWSVYLTLIFQASHVNDDVSWPVPDAEGKVNEDWAALQVEASLDFAHGDWMTTFLCGSLNYQAVHHLFPYISQAFYPEIADIVKDTAKEHGVRYNLKDSIWDMIRAHVTRIELFGEEPLPLR